jgi:hypothetical protein
MTSKPKTALTSLLNRRGEVAKRPKNAGTKEDDHALVSCGAEI